MPAEAGTGFQGVGGMPDWISRWFKGAWLFQRWAG